MQPATYTDGMRLAEAALQRDDDTATLADWLRERRDRGDSYESIARELTSAVSLPGYSVTHVTAKRWCLRLGLVEDEAAS